jgi:hypothetical protein
MLDIHVELLERTVEQHVQPFARSQLALGVLGIDPRLSAAHLGGRAHFLELLQDCEQLSSSPQRKVTPETTFLWRQAG